MATEHVVNVDKNKENSIFNLFNILLKSKVKNGKKCAALIDYLMVSKDKVGSSSLSEYSAKRLVRGLAAGEVDKQNIFFAALCTGISTGVLTGDIVLQALQNIDENFGSSKSDQSKKQVTTILSYGAIISSGKSSELTSEEVTEVLQKLFNVCNSKSYLKNAAVLFLWQFVLNSKKHAIKNNFVPALNQAIKADETAEHGLFAVVALAYLTFPKQMQKVVDSRFGGRNKIFEDICDRTLHLPFAMQEKILTLMCQEFTATISSSKALLKLWKNFLTKDQKFTPKRGTQLLLFLKIMLDVIPFSELIPSLLEPKVLDVLLKELQIHDKKSKMNAGYIQAKLILEKLVARVTDKNNEINLALPTLRVIFNHHGGLQFDRITKSNSVQSLMVHLDTNEAVHLLDDFMPKIHEGFLSGTEVSKNIKDIESMLMVVVKLVSNILTKKDSKSVSKYVKNIFDMAFDKTLNNNSALRSKATESFFKCLELNHIKIEDAADILNDVALYAEQNLDKLDVKLNPSELKQWKNMMAANAKLSNKSSDKKFAAVRLLLLQMGLLMFRDPTMASSTIEELLQCYERIKNKKKKKVESDDEPDWVEVTIDLLLAMLSRENKLLRHVVSSVFPGIVPHITPTAVQQLVDALDPGSRNDVLKHIDSDDSGDEEGEESDDDDDGDESEESDDAEEEETVNDKLRMAVRNALGYSAALTDDESVDMDEMNEEEEKRLNESLSNAFSLFRSGKKKKQTKDDEALMHFRIRVLDLVEIIISTNPTLSCCLELLNPLITLLENAIKDVYQKPLQNRLVAVLKKLGSVKKFADSKDVAYSDLVAALKGLFERETSALIYVEMASVLVECSTMIIRGSQLTPKLPEETSLEDVFSNLINRHFKLNDRKVPFSVFQATFRMLWDGNWSLSKRIMDMLLDSDLKLFKKFKLIELLEIFYKNDRLQSSATDDCKKATCSYEEKFVKKFTKSLLNYKEKKNSELLPTYYGHLITLIQLVIHTSSRFVENRTKTSPWAAVVSHLLANIQQLTQQKSRNKLIHLAQQLGLQIPDKSVLNAKVTQKRAAESEGDSDDETNKEDQSKKRKISVVSNGMTEQAKKQTTKAEIKKLKQESRELREAAFSQGLDVDFSNVNVETLDGSPSGKSKDVKTPQKKPRKSEISTSKKKKQKIV